MMWKTLLFLMKLGSSAYTKRCNSFTQTVIEKRTKCFKLSVCYWLHNLQLNLGKTGPRTKRIIRKRQKSRNNLRRITKHEVLGTRH
jgi:hypothetical protein